jgi:hypothetical protein
MDVPRLLSDVLLHCARSPVSLLVGVLRRLRGRRQLRAATASSAGGKFVVIDGREFKPSNPK